MKEKIESIEFDEASNIKTKDSVPLGPIDIDLVSHVDVDLTAIIGSAKISIKKLFSLKSGDTIRLNESLNSDIILEIDNKPVAKGKLVAVEDCFGVEITEIFRK